MTLSPAQDDEKERLPLSIIIVNWNSREFVRACLESIERTANDLAHEIFVVDNASFDGCEAMVRTLHPAVYFLQNQQNLGFAGANNLAFARSRGQNVLFLNPDTEILPGALQDLMAALASRADAGMVGAQLLNSDCSVQTTCIAATPSIANQTLNCDPLRRFFPRWRIWGMRALFSPAEEPVAVEAISGACMLGRRHVFEQVGAFSTLYFMYAEDMDLSLKVTRLGYKIYYIPAAKIIHHAGGSSSQRKENYFSDIVLRESLLQFFLLYRGRSYAAVYRTALTVSATLRLILLLLASPYLLLRSRGRSLRIALLKWTYILIWAVSNQRVPASLRSPTASCRTPVEI